MVYCTIHVFVCTTIYSERNMTYLYISIRRQSSLYKKHVSTDEVDRGS